MTKQEENTRKEEYKKTCKTAKVKFTSETAAIAYDDHINGGMLFPYLCPHCKFWHLTKRRPRKKPDKKQ